jgi:2-keto-4-pentenoate hydratase
MKSSPSSAKNVHQNNKPQDIALSFVTARKECKALDDFPGSVPVDLASGYQIQDIAIELWPEQPAGWKVGRIPPDVEGKMGIDRLAGPIFGSTIFNVSSADDLEMPVFAGGFAAVEAEYVAVIGADAPADKLAWSTDEAAGMIADLRIGLEIASSPLATINDLGPTVVVSDFGNNAGLIIGPAIEDWRDRELETMQCETFINGDSVGTGGAFKLTGGFIRSVQFLLELNASRGRPLRAGDVIATGQTNGIHDVVVGDVSRIDFGRDGSLSCKILAAAPR